MRRANKFQTRTRRTRVFFKPVGLGPAMIESPRTAATSKRAGGLRIQPRAVRVRARETEIAIAVHDQDDVTADQTRRANASPDKLTGSAPRFHC